MQVRNEANIRLNPEHGGRGCDYHDGVVVHRGKSYPVVLGFAGRKGPLAEYSIEIPHAEVKTMVDAMTATHGSGMRPKWLFQVSRARYYWRSGAVLIEIEKLPGMHGFNSLMIDTSVIR